MDGIVGTLTRKGAGMGWGENLSALLFSHVLALTPSTVGSLPKLSEHVPRLQSLCDRSFSTGAQIKFLLLPPPPLLNQNAKETPQTLQASFWQSRLSRGAPRTPACCRLSDAAAARRAPMHQGMPDLVPHCPSAVTAAGRALV